MSYTWELPFTEYFKRGVLMRGAELWHLRKLCDKHSVDYQEIDNTLTYWENKAHLISLLVERFVRLPNELSVRRLKFIEAQYIK